MTNKEQQTIDTLCNLVKQLQAENNKFKEDIVNKVTNIKVKVDKKELPITLEEDILKTSISAIEKSINEVLTKYDSPLVKLTREVIDEHSEELKNIVNDSFEYVIRTNDFKESIINAFSHKVARTIISNNDGIFDKVSNELKKDAIFKSKLVLAVSKVVEECLKEK